MDHAAAVVVAPNCLSQLHFSAFEIMQPETGKNNEKNRGKKPTGLIGHHQVKQYSYLGSPSRTKEKWAECLLKGTLAEHFPNLGKYMEILGYEG